MDIFQTLSTSNFSNYTTNYFRSFSDFIYSHKIINGSFLNILCCNIRSVNSNLDELLLFLENDKKNMLLDIIILTETWHDVNCCNISICDYNTYFTKIKRNQNDGIIVLYKKNLCIHFFEFDCNEANIVKLKINISNNPITFLYI